MDKRTKKRCSVYIKKKKFLENFKIKKIYNGEDWNPGLDSPLAQVGAEAKVGEYLVGVNGKAIEKGTNLYTYFEGVANIPTKIHLNSKPGLE